MGEILYAIGDIHGDFDQLQTILARIDADCAECRITEQTTIFIGDLVDRREDSRRVIDCLMDGIEAGRPWIVLKGNHDRMFSLFFDDLGARHLH